jgi:cytochrome c oxidase subunit I
VPGKLAQTTEHCASGPSMLEFSTHLYSSDARTEAASCPHRARMWLSPRPIVPPQTRACSGQRALMVTDENHSDAPRTPPTGFLRRYVFTERRTNHKTIGLNYLWLALFSVLLGMILSLLMRVRLVWFGSHFPFLSQFISTPGNLAALTLLHGSLMVFMVLIAAPQAGFGNYFLPIQIGARDMAFPTLNLLAFWFTVVSLLGMVPSFLLQADAGITLWIFSVTLFSAASLLNALNFSVTAIELRTTGMTLPRLPMTAWAWLINAILSLLIFSILLAACVCLLADRLMGTAFFLPSTSILYPAPRWTLLGQVLPSEWQRLFWFFSQAAVYVAMLPCFGIVTHLLATFSRRPVWRQRAVVLALCAVGLLGFCVWGQHMFATGMNPDSPLFFSVLAASLGLPASILLISWLATLWKAKVELTTAMLFALGFVSLFAAGGLSGIFLVRQDLSSVAVSDEFVAGHYHLVMGVTATFAILGALFFWFPKMFGRRISERLGKAHFWLTFVGVFCVFMPMHWLGLMSHATTATEGSLMLVPVIRAFVSVAALLTIAAQGLFLFNFFWSLARGEVVDKNPWRTATLEWSVASPSPPENLAGFDPVVYREAYVIRGKSEEFVPQNVQPTPSEGRRTDCAAPARFPGSFPESAAS